MSSSPGLPVSPLPLLTPSSLPSPRTTSSTLSLRFYVYLAVILTTVFFFMTDTIIIQNTTLRNRRRQDYDYDQPSWMMPTTTATAAAGTASAVKRPEMKAKPGVWTQLVHHQEIDSDVWVWEHPSLTTTTTIRPKQKVDMTVVILAMDRWQSLQRLLNSLMVADYRSSNSSTSNNRNGKNNDDDDKDNLDRIDLVLRFDRPPAMGDITMWEQQVHDFCQSNTTTSPSSLSSWKYGSVQVVVSRQNLGLAEAWFRAWTPQSNDDRALILEDDVELSPLWYRWLDGARTAYGNRTDLAAMSLSHQQLVPLKSSKTKTTAGFPQNEPFLYALLGSHGFSPLAHVWTEFIEFVRCTQRQQKKAEPVSVLTPELITSDWYQTLNQRGMWTQHFIYFCKHRRLYNLYQFPQTKALAAHWQEKGEHFDGSNRGRNFPLIQKGDMALSFPTKLKKYDWGANLIMVDDMGYGTSAERPVLVMSAAVGYGITHFKAFVGSLRRVYSGDVTLLISKTAASNVRSYLQEQNVQVVETDDPGKHCNGCESWEQLNRARFSFFEQVCSDQNYSLCLTTDFRDSLFQADPFADIDIPSVNQKKSLLFLYEHNSPMNEWHYDKMRETSCGLYTKYANYLENTNIINGGSIIASPSVFRQLVGYMRDTWQGCNDQVTLNILVRAKMLSSDTSVRVYRQGEGAMNVVGWGGKILKDSRRQYLNRNCLLSPVVHQYDIAGDF